MQSTSSMLLRTTLRRSTGPLVRTRARHFSAETSSGSTVASASASASTSNAGLNSEDAPSISSSSSSSSSNGASTSTSKPKSTPTPTPIIPSTSSTAEYVRQNGIPGFLPRESFENVERWVGGHWDRLEGEMRSNEALRNLLASRSARSGSPSSEPVDIVTLLSETARDPGCSVAFNSASLILNTSFFLEKLTRTGEVQEVSQRSKIPAAMEHLEDQLVGRARGMVGGGFLWLVRMKAGQGTKSVRYEIMPTHAAGTLLVRNRHMMGRNAMTDLFRPTDASNESTNASTSTSNVGGSDQSGATGPTSTMEPEHLRITPLACVSLFEHVYLPKYGVNGKEDYVRDWIRHLDWKSIEKA